MRSQKLNNRAPRPFKAQTDRWSGIRQQKSFIAAPKPAQQRPAKPGTSPEETPANAPDSSADQK